MKIFQKFFVIFIIIHSTYQVCDSNCLYCGDDEITCQECYDNFYLVSTDTSCVSNCPLGTVAIIDEKICSCDSSCYQCLETATHCTDCYGQYLLKTNNTCVDECPEGYYDPDKGQDTGEYTGWSCEVCDGACQTCEYEATKCIKCKENGKYAYQYQCVSASFCEQNFRYGDDTTKACESCVSPCKDCSGSATSCTSCVIGRYLQGTECVETCLSHYFEESATQLCTLCDPKCDECDVSFANCTLCPAADPTYLQNNNCITQCPPGTLANNSDINNKLCSNCFSPCSECQTTYSTCIRCTQASGLYLRENQCTDTCLTGQFKNQTDVTNRTCSQCVSPCVECTSESYCTKCDKNTEYYLTQNTCKLACPPGYWKNQTDSTNKLCSNCQSPCKTCEDSETKCISCVTNYYYYSPNNVCFLQCPVGTCKNDIYCLDCDKQTAYCSECSMVPTNCTKCTQESNTYLNGNACVTSQNCAIGTYPDYNQTDNKICKTCPENCSECTSGTACTKCTASSNHYLYGPNCIAECPIGTYPEGGNANNKLCLTCSSPCSECSKSVNNCTKCTTQSGLYLKGNACLDQCGVGYYIDLTVQYKLCTICVAPCIECESVGICTRCDGNQELYLNDNKCINTCPLKTFKNKTDSTNKECSDCLSSCADCLNQSYCLKCTTESGLYLLDNSCRVKCPDGTYVDNTVDYKLCTYCVDPCVLCTSDTYCLRCSEESGKYLLNNKCQDECPSKMFQDSSDPTNKVCNDCMEQCSECIENSHKCTKCVASLYLYDNVCLLGSNCPVNTFANSTTQDDRQCSACVSPCSECNLNSLSCTKCQQYSNTYLIASYYKCVSSTECPVGTFADSTNAANKLCSDCTSPCSECFGIGTYCNRCTQESGKYLSENSCVEGTDCPFGTYPYSADITNRTCSNCLYPCSSCTTLSECTSCDEQSGTKLVNGQCIFGCPSGQYLTIVGEEKFCKSCNSPCAECYESADSCTQCTEESGLYLSGLACVAENDCPVESYPESSDVANKICVPINPANTIYSYKTIAVAGLMAFVVFIYTTMIKI